MPEPVSALRAAIAKLIETNMLPGNIQKTIKVTQKC